MTVPTALKILKGTDQKCRTNPDEPKPPSDKIKIPSTMRKEARPYWNKTVKLLKDCKVMTVADVDALKLYCEAHYMYDYCNQRLFEDGIIIRRGPNATPTISPYLSAAEKAKETMIKIMKEMGMTAAARTKVQMVGKTGDKGGFDTL